MLSMSITRRLIVVPLANNNHGKTTMLSELVRQAARRDLKKVQRGLYTFTSPWGRKVEALVFIRSYQETLQGEHGPVESALSAIDKSWFQRDLIIFPSHIDEEHCKEIISVGKAAGFDLIVVPVVMKSSELGKYAGCLKLAWDMRWTISNDATDDHNAQVEALGHDLWTWIASAIENR